MYLYILSFLSAFWRPLAISNLVLPSVMQQRTYTAVQDHEMLQNLMPALSDGAADGSEIPLTTYLPARLSISLRCDLAYRSTTGHATPVAIEAPNSGHAEGITGAYAGRLPRASLACQAGRYALLPFPARS